jgi:hypothetical protein
MKRNVSALCIAVLLVPFRAHASDCGALAQFFDVCKAAREAGAEAAAEILKASRNIPLTTNQFGLLADEYDADDPKVREHARKVVQRVFPQFADAGHPALDFVLEVEFHDANTRQNTLTADIWPLNSNSPNDFQGPVHDGQRYKGEVIDSQAPASPALIETTRQKVQGLVKRATAPTVPYMDADFKGCFRNGGIYGQSIDNACVAGVKVGLLTDAIIAVTDEHVAIPSSNRITRAWKGGGYAVVLIPKEEFDKQPQSMWMTLTFHVAGDPSKTAKDFETPYKFSMPLIRSTAPLPTIDPRYGSFRYAIVDLRIPDFVGQQK